MQELKSAGKVRAIGVSNFTIAHLKELIDDPGTHITPAVNQVEFHPLLFSVQRPLLEFCREHGIVLQAYAPLGSTDGVSQVLNHPTLTAIATKHGVTAADVALRWALNHGVSVIPKSSDPRRIRANAAPSLLTRQHQQQVSSDREKAGRPDVGVPGGPIAPIFSSTCDWVLTSDDMEALNEISGRAANVGS
eukprot:COSAG02_NODE_24102_length_697_cov_2.200669_1_plen_190_part_10